MVEDPLDFLKVLQKYSAGDTTLDNITRVGKELTKTVIIKYPPQKQSTIRQKYLSVEKCIRRDGFSKVFVYDSAIKADELADLYAMLKDIL
jgi:hypothetical protein